MKSIFNVPKEQNIGRLIYITNTGCRRNAISCTYGTREIATLVYQRLVPTGQNPF